MKKTFLALGAFLSLGIGGLFHATNASADSSTLVYRLYNPNTGEHFYTGNSYEEKSLSANGWVYEGIGWQAATSGTSVYRVYNPNAKGGDNYYTMSKYEAQTLVNSGWKYGAVAWKVQGEGHTITPPPVGITVYVTGKNSKVYWYSREALIAYGKKIGNPVNQSQIFTMTESQAISSGRHHSLKE
ncbi:Cell wall surface anchor family protein [Lactococcus lactis subsp. lactis]|uniref:Glycoside hydrolase, family 25 n=2 Tax=Lactococcus lactis TaxID=1358 RepID=A0A2A5S9B6_LACLH|nr:hypothetical protein [Lactococcus lactis]KAA8700049.1 glycoside hydrolase, family 25 [Lactococcus lactis subsp. hordniae]KSU13904.1 Cell wall surface anchor family protein [Lactococcus lactis subsp. lactis]MCT3134616.1 glycoside hydrolase, family 25 [Lactococcus lactis]PCS10096.1 surface antigen [Lactococcus lactis subsp. hordniae]